MHNQDNQDISNVQVPQSFIQEVLSQTEPLKESREEIYPTQQKAQVSEEGEITKLLSLIFEEFDKLNARLDKLQESVNERTGSGSGMAPGALPMGKKKLESAFERLLRKRGVAQ